MGGRWLCFRMPSRVAVKCDMPCFQLCQWSASETCNHSFWILAWNSCVALFSICAPQLWSLAVWTYFCMQLWSRILGIPLVCMKVYQQEIVWSLAYAMNVKSMPLYSTIVPLCVWNLFGGCYMYKDGWVVCWSNIAHTHCMSGFNQKLQALRLQRAWERYL